MCLCLLFEKFNYFFLRREERKENRPRPYNIEYVVYVKCVYTNVLKIQQSLSIQVSFNSVNDFVKLTYK